MLDADNIRKYNVYHNYQVFGNFGTCVNGDDYYDYF